LNISLIRRDILVRFSQRSSDTAKTDLAPSDPEALSKRSETTLKSPLEIP
jgi:hypothetical protein